VTSDFKVLQYLVFKLGYKIVDDIKDITRTQISFLVLGNPEIRRSDIRFLDHRTFARLIGSKLVKVGKQKS